MSFGKLSPEQSVALIGLGSALRGQDPAQAVFQARGVMEQRTLKEQEKERQKRLEQLAQTNPQLAKMYELFGEKGLQTGYINQLEAQKAEQNKIALQNEYMRAGLSREDATLLAAGINVDDIKKLRADETTSDKIIQNVKQEVETVAQETNYQDAYSNLSEAFGPIDAVQETINQATRLIAGEDVAGETGAAIRARDNLNLEILANLAADFTGRPNMLIYEEIRKILPTSSGTSEKDAYEKYINVLQRTESRIKSLENGLKSDLLSDANKEKYRDELFKSEELKRKLEAATLSLKGKTSQDVLEPVNFVSEGKYDYLYKG
jgi:hypothetical protein